ncbi:exodeoxyribonuclease VII small subunit [Sulfobacillus harzensis]|uniref:Exodeoxyribonuclease VII small subunit n=1 Tax=Sulfobacillus harzensis TaxID=2729629 RepID=A0A7Y0L161_9FIRM|nr:exodeoxyribonuclease VII small subunit [Sulfobacillus harzensis]NMP21148.1 exodeoxyribonuclease VII small subunit [Sulfobacillus harzensis]
MNEERDLDQYESIMARLEEIVKLLETGRAPLGESLRLYQEAKSLSQRANQLLERAESLMGTPKPQEA